MTEVPTAAHDWAATESLLRTLLPATEQQRHLTRLQAGSIIHRYGSTCRGVFFVKEGTIEISLPAKDGVENFVFRIGAGGAVGLTAAIARGGHESAAVVAEPVTGYFVPVETLRAWLEQDPTNYLRIAPLLSDWNGKVFDVLRSGQLHKKRAAAPIRVEIKRKKT